MSHRRLLLGLGVIGGGAVLYACYRVHTSPSLKANLVHAKETVAKALFEGESNQHLLTRLFLLGKTEYASPRATRVLPPDELARCMWAQRIASAMYGAAVVNTLFFPESAGGALTIVESAQAHATGDAGAVRLALKKHCGIVDVLHVD